MSAPTPSVGATAPEPIRIGIAGFGTAGRSFIPSIRAHPGFDLVCIAEPDPTVRDEIARELGVRAYEGLEQMLAHGGLDAVYIATPTVHHTPHVLLAVAAGKHVLVEKPMAINVAQALPMVEAAQQANIVFVVGHSHGFDLPVQRMHEIIEGGSLGRVRMVNTACYTDWMHRPRRPDERDTRLGGGVTYRQGAHQFDILRLLCGGLVRSVRARTFEWRADRPGIGAHSVFLDFHDGSVATAIYNGYGGFSSGDLCFDITESGFHQPHAYAPRVAAPAANAGTQDVLKAKQERARRSTWTQAPFQPFFGLTVVSCERGDMRQSAEGLLLYTAQGKTEILLPTDRNPRALVLDELHDAIRGLRPALHDARWGLANLEVCDAAIASSVSGREVELRHQVPVHR